MKLGALDADERADVAPQRLQLDVTEHLALLIQELPAVDSGSRARHGGVESDLAHCAHGVRLHGYAATNRVPMRIPFDDFGIEPAATQGGGQTQAGDATTHDQDVCTAHHTLPPTAASQP